ncbi:MAG: TonB-dependent receptor, partial [Gemmatimonadales bacterium]|nr:TonB-dependent receptor [Gemmatimonadales bacterium]
ITPQDLRSLPLTTLQEAVEIQAGVVGGSFRGGRVGQEALVLDGLSFKNQLDASSGYFGIRIPTIAIEEASVVTNGFSALYGQALSGIVTADTKDGGDRLEGSLAIETDRPLPSGWDAGLDRLTLSLGGPLVGRLRFFVAAQADARLDDDPVNAPAPADTLDPRSGAPWLLPHSSGEHYDLLAKLTLPLGRQQVIRVLGVASEQQRQLFDQTLKYTPGTGSGEHLGGRLLMLHHRYATPPDARTTVVADLRAGYFDKDAMRARLLDTPELAFGGFSFGRWRFAGESIATARDTVAAREPIPGYPVPVLVDNSPYGVPAFFATASPRSELLWNRFREGRVRGDLLIGPAPDTDLRFGAEYVRQRVETFSRLEAYRTVADSVPPPTAARFEPYQASGYFELQQRAGDMTFTAGLRADVFNGRSAVEEGVSKTQVALGPRAAFSTSLGGATVVASWGRFAQPPDFQYLVDAAFDDTLRTGRFRRGNPALGFETSTQYELQVRVRPAPLVGLRVGAYVKRLQGLVASVPLGFDPDSAVFASGDFGDVRGIEASLEREFDGVIGARVSYVLQQATATASNARDLYRRLQITSIGDTVLPADVQFPLDYDRRHTVIVVVRAQVPASAGKVLGGTFGSSVVRWGSGLPFTMTNLTGDSLLGLPNSQRLPSEFSLDLLLRRDFPIGGTRLGVYVDVRNLTDKRNVLAVRRDTGQPEPTDEIVEAMSQNAYAANPYPIPYESPRYRAWADLDRDGLISGAAELLPLYRRAARDYALPLFCYGPPRLVRLGVEIAF